MPGTRTEWKNTSPCDRSGIDLSIICVNWNSVGFLRECIASIYETVRGLTFEIIVVDNASPEGGVDTLGELFPRIRIIHSEENLGFAGANNLGFEYSTGTFVLFLNPDTHVLGPAIQTMVEHMLDLNDCGVIGCKLLNTDLSIQTSCIQTFPTIVNQLFDLDSLRKLLPRLPMWGTAPLFSSSIDPVAVEVVSGACMMLRRKVFKSIGLFSTDYFMYAEDLDLCYKAIHNGYANYYIPGATIIHHGQKSSSKQGAGIKSIEWAIAMRCESVSHFCAKTRGRTYARLYQLAMAFSSAFRVLILAVLSLLGRFTARARSRREAAFAKWRAVFAWSLRHRPPITFNN